MTDCQLCQVILGMQRWQSGVGGYIALVHRRHNNNLLSTLLYCWWNINTTDTWMSEHAYVIWGCKQTVWKRNLILSMILKEKSRSVTEIAWVCQQRRPVPTALCSTTLAWRSISDSGNKHSDWTATSEGVAPPSGVMVVINRGLCTSHFVFNRISNECPLQCFFRVQVH